MEPNGSIITKEVHMIITKFHEIIKNLKKEKEPELEERYNVLLNNAKNKKRTFGEAHCSASIWMIFISLLFSFGIGVGLEYFFKYNVMSSFIIYICVFCGPILLSGFFISCFKVKDKKAIKFISENKEKFTDSFFDDEVASLELLKEYKACYGSEKLKALLYENNNEEISIGDLKKTFKTSKYRDEYKKLKKTNEIVDQL